MDKQELIKRIDKLPYSEGPIADTVTVNRCWILKSLKQLDEPQKVAVPQFVADWIEEAKKSCKDVAELFDFDFTNDEVGKWFMQERPFDLVARAWLDGYEVEKEKKYKVKFKNIRSGTRYLKYDVVIEKWYFGINQNSSAVRLCHTKKELEEAGFGWVFDCPGIEIEVLE
ncbi:DUF1642 domain-containing protein [Streptococcus parasanguinis]|uniref:DUF1642 domain-containing protein n=1 Tax=Streptococcus parasanguinis TaxID=1318 RepID=UPI00352D22F2